MVFVNMAVGHDVLPPLPGSFPDWTNIQLLSMMAVYPPF